MYSVFHTLFSSTITSLLLEYICLLFCAVQRKAALRELGRQQRHAILQQHRCGLSPVDLQVGFKSTYLCIDMKEGSIKAGACCIGAWQRQCPGKPAVVWGQAAGDASACAGALLLEMPAVLRGF